MWLEGAYQSGWSVAEMRRKRAETLGAVAGEREASAAIESLGDSATDGERLDEDSEDDDSPAAAGSRELRSRGAESSDGSDRGTSSSGTTDDFIPFDADDSNDEAPPVEPRRPFAQLAELPDDLGEPYEALKVAIIRHKFAAWKEVTLDDVLAAIDALRELALAPA
jgi:hypothetical protein